MSFRKLELRGVHDLLWNRYYLSIALYPLVATWGVYSLLYYPHKSWWSWLINTLANGPLIRYVLCCS